jgi:hypothetical protein
MAPTISPSRLSMRTLMLSSGMRSLAHKLDQQQARISSRDSCQLPDLLVAFNAAGPFLIVVSYTWSQRSQLVPAQGNKKGCKKCPCGGPWSQRSYWSQLFGGETRTPA